MNLIEKALEFGFDKAAIIDAKDLTFVKEYRVYCEENLCGQYDKNPACPPASGTVDEMVGRCAKFSKALVLQMILGGENFDDTGMKRAKFDQNVLTEKFVEEMAAGDITETLIMSAGPYKGHSCMSAYCLDAQKTADLAGMDCWADDGKVRIFTVVLY